MCKKIKKAKRGYITEVVVAGSLLPPQVLREERESIKKQLEKERSRGEKDRGWRGSKKLGRGAPHHWN